MIEKILILIGLHCIADYPLQGDFLAKTKSKNLIAMIAHCFVWATVIYTGFKFLDVSVNVWVFCFLLVGHQLIDTWKCSRAGNGKELTTDLLIDQIAHLLQIVIVLIIYT